MVLGVRPEIVVTVICCGVDAAVESMALGPTEQTAATGARHGLDAVQRVLSDLVTVDETPDWHWSPWLPPRLRV